MRRALLVFVAAALSIAGVHCGSAEADPIGKQEDPVADTPPPAGASGAPTNRPNPGITTENGAGTEDEETGPVVTSTVRDDDGNIYEAGTFTRSITIGGLLLRSHGGRDVFLVKRSADDSQMWALRVGGPLSETSPTITLRNGQVNVLGSTEGRMDCGTGPLNSWSSETFFLCVFDASDGTALVGGAFPTGQP